MKRACPARTALAVIGFASSAGVSPAALLRAAGLDAQALADPDAYIPHAQELKLWDEAVRLTGDEDFGIHFAEWLMRSPPSHFDVLAFAIRSCATLGEHIRLASRYFRLLHEGVYLTVEEDGQTARVVHGHIPEQIGPRQPMEAALAVVLLHARQAVGDDLTPQAVCFSHPRPARVSEQARVFGAPVHYGRPRNALVLDRAALERPQRHAERRLLAILNRQLGALVPAAPDRGIFVDAVARYMIGELPEREPTVAKVAAKLSMSTRTLQRRLRREGTTFNRLLSDVRRDRALHYLQDPRVSISEVAFSLGFLDVTSFHRAFKRWTGDTPAAFRGAVARGR